MYLMDLLTELRLPFRHFDDENVISDGSHEILWDCCPGIDTQKTLP